MISARVGDAWPGSPSAGNGPNADREEDAAEAAGGAEGVCGAKTPKDKGRVEAGEGKAAKRPRTESQKRNRGDNGFPKGAVKRIMKLGEDTRNVSTEALVLITKASELFLERFAKETLGQAQREGRRTIKYQDLSDVRMADPNLIFLEAVVPP
ncbi:unnamed protein product [Discosporangium mesarthrocarpum]